MHPVKGTPAEEFIFAIGKVAIAIKREMKDSEGKMMKENI